jgi:hypothetical protein
MTADPRSLTASFTVQMAPDAPIPGADGRFTLTKTWTGAVEGSSHGTMLTAGVPESGSAGYIAAELFEGSLEGRTGTLVLQQLGTMTVGEPVLHYVIVPGSGTGELAGTTGTLEIGDIHDDGRHEVRFDLD